MTGIVHVEVWKSSENREERHYFLNDAKSHGYQNAEYLFGVNPRYFDDEKVRRILEILNDGR
jgi:hypothetical protein